VRALSEPQFTGGRYASLLAAFDRGGLSRVVDRFHIDGVLFVLYQVIGVLFFGVAVVLAVAALALVVGRINHALASRGQWLWARLAGLADRPWRGPAATMAVGCVFALVSWFLCSGLGYDLIHGLTASAVRSH
jgi:hypothetical protein